MNYESYFNTGDNDSDLFISTPPLRIMSTYSSLSFLHSLLASGLPDCLLSSLPGCLSVYLLVCLSDSLTWLNMCVRSGLRYDGGQG